MSGSPWIIEIRESARNAMRGERRGEIFAGALVLIAAIALAIWLGYRSFPNVRAQVAQNGLPTPQNPIVAIILDSSNQPTNIEPLIVVANGQLHIGVPEPKSSFRPGRYKLELWIWKDGVIYYTENDFTWGVLAVNFNKSIYNLGDKAQIGFGVLDDAGRTICDAVIDMGVSSPSGRVSRFSTGSASSPQAQNKKISRNSSCGPGTVTNNPDYSASLVVDEVGTYNVSVVATTANGTRQISDSFEAQNLPEFDVERIAPTRIYPPVAYNVAIPIKANADFTGNIVETAPGSFDISAGAPSTSSGQAGAPQKNFTHDTQTISWPVNLKKGDSISLGYSFKAPDVSPELYKLGPLQIGNWQEAREWQIAADAVANRVVFVTSTASTTWTVPSDWNNASNTIEVIGGGGGGAVEGTSNRGGPGGGGGAYAKISNFSTSTTGGSVRIQVGTGGGSGASGTVTFFNWNGSGSTSTCSAGTMSLCAAFGGAGLATVTAGPGGSIANSVATSTFGNGTSTNAGGNGGVGSTSATAGAGGGGAGGPSGNGNPGQNAASAGGQGGSGDAGFGGTGGATSTTPGGTGGNGLEWTSSPGGLSGGSGGGGGGPTTNSGTGGTGGNYGAGGGGARGSSANTGGVGTQGIIVITYTPATITLSSTASQAAPVTIGPGANATTSDSFTFQTNAGTSTITLATTTISTSTGVYQIQIANSAGTTVYGSSTNPTTSTLSISLSGMNVSTTATTFLIMVKPLVSSTMPTASGDYVVTSTLTAWTDSKSWGATGANTTSSIVTIDNSPPANVTNASGVAGNAQITLSWNNPGDADFATTTVLRATSSISAVPADQQYYTVGNTIGSSTVACVASSTVSSCIDSGLTNGTSYFYKIFTADTYLNYSAGAFQGTLPLTPSANSPPTVSGVVLNHANAITLTPNATTSFDINWSVSDPNGCTDINTNKATSTAFRFGVRSTCAVPNPTTSNLNCYFYATRVTSTCSGTTINVTDTVQLYYFAQSTGNNSSSFPTDHWEAYALANDAANTTSSATSSDVDVNVLLALQITTTTIDYGTVLASSTTTGNTTTIQNVGNASQTLQISGSAPTLGATTNSIATSSQQYATSSFSFGAGVPLSDSVTTVSGFSLASPTSTSAVQNNIFWGIGVPAGKPTGTYSGTNTFTAIWSQ